MNSPKILIIEDEIMFSKLLEKSIKRLDKQLIITIIMNKEEALKHLELEENKPDFIFLDTNLPETRSDRPSKKSGEELMRYFNKKGYKFTVITGGNDKMIKAMAHAYNAIAYLKKPNGSGIKEFRTSIKRILNGEHDFIKLSVLG